MPPTVNMSRKTESEIENKKDLSLPNVFHVHESHFDAPKRSRPRVNKASTTGSIRDGRSSSDSSYGSEICTPLPGSTSNWDIFCLESLGIYYSKQFFPLPSDILDMVYKETGAFGQLIVEQKEYVKELQNGINFSFNISDIKQIHQNKYVQKMKEDIKIIHKQARTPFPSVVEEFIMTTKDMLIHLSEYMVRERCPVPKDVFVDMFKLFVRMCRLKPTSGSSWRSSCSIYHKRVVSESDVVIMPRDDCKETNIVSVVSIAEVKNVSLYSSDAETEQGKTLVLGSSSSESLNNEKSVCSKPAIYERIPPQVLGQHGGGLLIHNSIYDNKLWKGRSERYVPGMIVMGTRVIFTLLVLKYEHLVDLIQGKDICGSHKSYIYYSEPKDILHKADRDLLFESFARLNNI